MATCGADHHQESTNEEMRTFKIHFADLSDIIQSPTSLANRLYSADLLLRDTRRTICSLQLPTQQMETLLDSVEGQIKMDPQNFYKFVDELEKDSPMQHLCNKLRSTCAQLKSHTMSSVTLPLNTSAQQIGEHDTMLPSSSSSSPSSSSHSSTAVTRDKYRVFLKDCYQQPLPDNDKLLATASKHYIELAVISREGVTFKEADEFTKKSLHGLNEEILRKKTHIELKDILKPKEDGKPVRCVLVEGAPGIGKSTLAWEVCHKWEELDSVKQYELVVLIRLREKGAQKARCLEDLLSCDDETINKKELVAAIGRGKKVLIVCDGFDELPREQQQEGSVYIKLLKGRLLQEAAIIVTCRPSVRADLWRLCQHNIDRHLEVIGFAEKDIKRFAASVFSGDILEGFLSYITNNPPIYSMMYIPLNAVIVALIYQDIYDTDTPFPTTMTQLFDALTRALIRRHFASSHNEFHMPSSLQRIEDINKLPTPVVQQLLKLARVAYESLHKSRYVFTDLGENFEGLGMMKKTTSLNVSTGRECSYTFLHLALQEYMAALYIAIECPSGLDWAMFESGRHNVVVRFLAGICRKDEDHGCCYKKLVKLLLHRMIKVAECTFIGGCSGIDNDALLQLVHCVYECPSIMQSVNDKNLVGSSYIEPLVGFDWYVTGYCISHFYVEWGLSTKHATDNNVDLLVKGLRSSSKARGKIQTLHLHSSCKSLSQLKEFCQLHTLCIRDASNDNDDEVNLCELIEHQSRLKRVECGHSLLKFGNPGLGSVIPLLLGLSSLEELKVDSKLDIKINAKLLPHSNTNLKKLTIQEGHVRPLATLLPVITSLTYLQIDGEVTGSNISVLITTVQSLPKLTVLCINTTEYDLSELLEGVGNSRLKELRINSHWYDKLPGQIKKQYNYLLKRNT